MKLSLFIAKRYLFSKKKQNAINIISVISVVGVAIGTSALVIILSVFNGIDLLLQKSADSFTPDLVISPLTGKFSHFDDSLYQVLRNNSSVAYYNQIVEEKALVKYDDKLSPVTIKGLPTTMPVIPISRITSYKVPFNSKPEIPTNRLSVTVWLQN